MASARLSAIDKGMESIEGLTSVRLLHLNCSSCVDLPTYLVVLDGQLWIVIWIF